MKSRKTLFVALLVILMFGTVNAAYAWIQSSVWPNTNNVYYTTTTSLSADGVTSFGNANNAWNNVSGTTKHIYRSGSNSATDFNPNGANEVFKANAGNNAGIMTTQVWTDISTGKDVEFDMRINTYYPWSNSGAAGYYDVQNAATHEIGHALWSDDVTDKYCAEPQYIDQWQELTMYAWSSTGETKKRTLHQDDIDGFLASY